MSFNLDDPLAGILSDGSDDSFFDDDILGKKKPAKKKDTPIAGKKNALFDLGETDKSKTASVMDSKKEALFELGGDAKKIPAPSDKIESRASPAPLKRTVSKDSFKIPQTESKSKPLDVIKSPAKPKVSASTDKIDILSEFGSEPKSLGKGKSSQSILDDILGGSSTKAGSSQASRPPTSAKSHDFDFDSFLGKSDSKPPPKTAPQKPNAKFDIPKEATKKEEPRKKAGGDWLGIFQEDEAESEKHNAEMPSWLVGSDTKNKTDSKKVKPEPVREQPKIETVKDEIRQEVTQAFVEEVIPKVVLPIVPSVLQGSSEDITAEGAALYLQQQDSQLMVAMQLKAQEERLVAMQGKYPNNIRVGTMV